MKKKNNNQSTQTAAHVTHRYRTFDKERLEHFGKRVSIQTGDKNYDLEHDSCHVPISSMFS